MDHRQDHNAAHQSDCVPPLLTVLKPIKNDKMRWITPDQFCHFKGDSMFSQVDRSLALAPFKP